MYDLRTVMAVNDLQSSASSNEVFLDDQPCWYGVDVQYFRDNLQNWGTYSILTQ
jgi:hypothetical protein